MTWTPTSFVYIISYFVVTLISLPSLSQQLYTTLPLSIGAPFLEPDGRKVSLKLNDGFVALIKLNGNLTGESDYSLDRYDSSFNILYKIPLKVGSNEDYKELFFNGTDLLLFSVSYSKELNRSKLVAYAFDPETGAKRYQKDLCNVDVKEWTSEKSKGAVRETFENTISSYQNKSFITPLIYQYEIKYSPDSSKILAYIYDYSQKSLSAQTFTFDRSLNKIAEAKVPIDNNFINYGIHINNRGDLYVLNVDRSGKASLIQIQHTTNQYSLLSIENSSGNRENFKLSFLNDDIIYLGSVITKKEIISGVMYAKLDFLSQKVEKVRIFETTDSLKNEIDFTKQPIKGSNLEEDWKNLDLTHFLLDSTENVILVLEKREIIGTNITYTSNSANDFKHWGEKKASVHTGGVLIVSFNSDNELKWKNYFNKSQKADVSSGLISTSFVLDNSLFGHLRMLFTISDNPSGALNVIKFMVLNQSTGEVLTNQTLPNEENISLIKDYTIWWDNKPGLPHLKNWD